MPKRITKSKRELWKALSKTYSPPKMKTNLLSANWSSTPIHWSSLPTAIYGDDVFDEIQETLAKHMSDEIDKEILNKLTMSSFYGKFEK